MRRYYLLGRPRAAMAQFEELWDKISRYPIFLPPSVT